MPSLSDYLRKGISVVICCHNSAERIEQTLIHLANQEVKAGIQWEVILVDNRSSDGTSEIAEQTWQKFNSSVSFRCVFEPLLGVANARQLGIAEAKFEYLVFCDDDNWLSPEYVSIAFEVMEQNPKIGVLGGYAKVVTDSTLPEWFQEYRHGYAIGRQATSSGDITNRGFVWGAGMVVRKSDLKSMHKKGFKHFLSGRKASELLAGEDSEICKWHLLEGYLLWYDERLVFQHFLPAHRLNEEYRDRMYRGFDKSYPILDAYQEIIDGKKYREFGLLGLPIGIFYFLYSTFRKKADPALFEKRLSRAQLMVGKYLPLKRPLYDVLKCV